MVLLYSLPFGPCVLRACAHLRGLKGTTKQLAALHKAVSIQPPTALPSTWRTPEAGLAGAPHRLFPPTLVAKAHEAKVQDDTSESGSTRQPELHPFNQGTSNQSQYQGLWV